jgi:DUF438 domain-containing protein
VASHCVSSGFSARLIRVASVVAICSHLPANKSFISTEHVILYHQGRTGLIREIVTTRSKLIGATVVSCHSAGFGAIIHLKYGWLDEKFASLQVRS